MFKGFIFDLDGTVYLSDRLIPGADEVIRLLREKGRKVVFLSNKPMQPREDYALKLTRLGIPTRPDGGHQLHTRHDQHSEEACTEGETLCRGRASFCGRTEKEPVLRSPKSPREIDYVVVAFDRTFDYRKLNIAFQAIKLGAHFVATNPDRTCPVEGGEIPDCAGNDCRDRGGDSEEGGTRL